MIPDTADILSICGNIFVKSNLFLVKIVVQLAIHDIMVIQMVDFLIAIANIVVSAEEKKKRKISFE